jgi:hypothetical protein
VLASALERENAGKTTALASSTLPALQGAAPSAPKYLGHDGAYPSNNRQSAFLIAIRRSFANKNVPA